MNFSIIGNDVISALGNLGNDLLEFAGFVVGNDEKSCGRAFRSEKNTIKDKNSTCPTIWIQFFQESM